MPALFMIENRAVIPYPEVLLIEPFKTIWARDKSEKKDYAMEEFAYMEFLTSMRVSNPFRQYDEAEKEKIVRKAIITRKGWKPDKKIKEGMESLIKFQTEASSTYSYYMSTKALAEKMKKFYHKVNLNQVNPKTLNPLYKPKDITAALKDTEQFITSSDAIAKKVEEELQDTSRNRGGKRVSYFADPESLADE